MRPQQRERRARVGRGIDRLNVRSPSSHQVDDRRRPGRDSLLDPADVTRHIGHADQFDRRATEAPVGPFAADRHDITHERVVADEGCRRRYAGLDRYGVIDAGPIHGRGRLRGVDVAIGEQGAEATAAR